MLAAPAAAGAWFPIVDEVYGSREQAAAIIQDRFDFNHEAFTLRAGFDWTANPSRDIEWLILLHKFYYAPALGREWQRTGDSRYLDKWIELTDSWIDQVRVDFLPSDVAGRRLQNWVSAWHYFAGVRELPAGFRERFLASVAAQTDWLATHLTPARNHRTLELLALFMVAMAFPDLSKSAGWSTFARQAITDNLLTDLRADGVHCEQSTDYHHIVLRNALYFRRLASLNGIQMPEAFDRQLRKALDFALHVQRPDGIIPSLSDGDSASFLNLLEEGAAIFGDQTYRWAATRGRTGHPPAERIKAFPEGGYYIIRSGWGVTEPFGRERYLVFDCGPLGEGNHGHFDLLGFELYGVGKPLIVDPGRYTYDESGPVNWRAAFRGTACHNTVSVDGRNQTRYEFHKRKFKIRGPAPRYELLGFGSRDGYDFVLGRAESAEYEVVHDREIRFLDGGWRVLVVDDLLSSSEHRYVQTFQLSPDAQGRTRQSADGGSVAAPHLTLRSLSSAAPAARCSIEDGWVSPEYGVKVAAPVVRFHQTGASVRFETLLEIYP